MTIKPLSIKVSESHSQEKNELIARNGKLHAQNCELVEQLHCMAEYIEDINSCLYSAQKTVLHMSTGKKFKLMHFLNRLTEQLLRGSFSEKRAFFSWLFKHLSTNGESEQRFTPLYPILQQLNVKRKKFDLRFNANGIVSSRQLRINDAVFDCESIQKTLKESRKKYDVIFLSIINYTFRHQRPQHIADYFAKEGHRTYYINAELEKETRVTPVAEKPNLYEVHLGASDTGSIYADDWRYNSQTLYTSFDELILNNCITDCAVICEYPNWHDFSLYLKRNYGFPVILDYLDDFTGFADEIDDELADNCLKIIKDADKVIATSKYLGDLVGRIRDDVTLIRNGTEFEHFNKAYKTNLDPGENRRKSIGYYGAIAKWFDFEKINFLAKALPDVDFVFIGEVSVENAPFNMLPNIKLLGEKSYSELPKYLADFDVCLIPFDTSTDLIKATNPVKFYEYLSAGKKIVATEIPELEEFKDRFAYLTNENEKFLEYIELCLSGTDTLASPEDAMAFAKGNDWSERVAAVKSVTQTAFPLVSIIVLAYNQIKYTRLCIQSIIEKTAYPCYELILVDNASVDGTPAYFTELAEQYPFVKCILNQENFGFAKGNNIGIKAASGKYIVLLNNDTVVTHGWITAFLKHYTANPKLGLLGPVTNSIGNEAKIKVDYTDISDMDLFAYKYTRKHWSEIWADVESLAMYCLVISRTALDVIGLLDEAYGVGMFEDDDYCNRAREAGFDLYCAEDVFIHHFLNISFAALGEKLSSENFLKNQKIFEERWGREWRPHKYRPGVS